MAVWLEVLKSFTFWVNKNRCHGGYLKLSGIGIIFLVDVFSLLLNRISFQNRMPGKRRYAMRLVLPRLSSVGPAGFSWGDHLLEGIWDGPKVIYDNVGLYSIKLLEWENRFCPFRWMVYSAWTKCSVRPIK